MNTTIDKQTNKRSSDRKEANRSIDLSVFPFGQSESINDECSLLDDDHDEDNLTLLDLKMKSKNVFDQHLSIFDELEQQCQAVLKSTSNKSLSTLNQSKSKNLESILSNHMKNDYERRFQESLQKLIIPSWFVEQASGSKKSDQSLTKKSCTNENHLKLDRTPEIIHVRRPQTTRSCRSSLVSSPSASLHSWHPKQMIDGMNCLSLTSSSSIHRRSEKYEKAIDRVTKSSRWYQPSQFLNDKNNKQISVVLVPLIKMSDENQCQETSKFNEINQRSLINDGKATTHFENKRSNHFSEIRNVENEMIDKLNNSRYYSTTIDKLDEKSKVLDESQLKPIESEKMSFDRVELEEITDDEEADKLSVRRNSSSTTVAQNIEQISNDVVLQRLAKDLVDSILVEVFQSKYFPDDVNSGVRELSDDENQLRELDENEINETDEFIVFPTQIDSNDQDGQTSNKDQQQNRTSLNKLYTFSRNSDESMNSTKNQDSLTSDLITTDKDLLTTIETITKPTESQPMNNDQATPIYRSHIQKRNINLGRYYDGMMRASQSQLPTHDLRPSLVMKSPNPILDESKTSEGITEETVRKARILLDSIPNIIDVKPENDPSQEQHQKSPIRSILKNTSSLTTDQTNEQKNIYESIDRGTKATHHQTADISPRRIVTTTITEEYHRVQRQIIEQFDQEVPRQKYSIVSPTVPNVDASIYESLSECYSGYSSLVSDFISKPTTKLTSQVSSVPSASDEAYESDPTLSACSPTMTEIYIHPNLVHEFEYPSPPPPIPDRNLKPIHLRPPPPVKPRSKKSKTTDSDLSTDVQRPISSPLNMVQTIVSSTSESSSSVRSMSSRHYCGSLPPEKESIKTNTDQSKDKRHSALLNCLQGHEDGNQSQETVFSRSLINQVKSKPIDSKQFNETTNSLVKGLSNSRDSHRESMERSNQSRESTTLTTNKQRPITDQNNTDGLSIFETSV